MKKQIILISFTLFFSLLFANNIEEKQKDYRNSNLNNPTLTTKTYEDAVESDKPKDWNNQNWMKHLK